MNITGMNETISTAGPASPTPAIRNTAESVYSIEYAGATDNTELQLSRRDSALRGVVLPVLELLAPERQRGLQLLGLTLSNLCILRSVA